MKQEGRLLQSHSLPLFIGVDPGNNTGISFWYKNEKQLVCRQYKTHIEAILSLRDELKHLWQYNIRFRIEDARKQRKRPDLAKINRGKEQGVGSVKARSKDWEDFCVHFGYEYELCEPKNTPYKNNPELFKRLTGVSTLKGQDHLRDSAMLVFGY